MTKFRVKGDGSGNETPPSNVVPMHRAPKTGLLTRETFLAAAKLFVAQAGAAVVLNGRRPADIPAVKAWAAYLASINYPNTYTLRSLEALSTVDALLTMPTRWPSEMTGIAADDRHGCTDA